jgi:uncharacterized protein
MEEHPFSTTTLEITDQVPQNWTWKDVLLISSFSAVILIAGVGLLRFLSQRSLISLEDNNAQIYLSLASLILETIALILPIYILGVRRKKIPWSVLGIQSCRLEWVLLAGLLGFIAIPISGVVAAIIQLVLGKSFENPQLPFLVPAGSSVLGGIAMLLLGGLLAPLAEEFFFRGFLYQWLRQRWGVAPGIIISSLIFGIMHGDWAVGGAAFVLGIILAYSFEKSKSLWSNFIIHAINNSVKIALLYILLASGLLSNLL